MIKIRYCNTAVPYFYAFFEDNKMGENMKIKEYVSFKNAFGGIAIGFINGLLGAGGGMIAVPILKQMGLSQKDAQANAIAVILPISVISAALYLLQGNVTVADAVIYIPGGIIGTVIGTFLLSKLSSKTLKRIFGGFMVFAGVRLLMK